MGFAVLPVFAQPNPKSQTPQDYEKALYTWCEQTAPHPFEVCVVRETARHNLRYKGWHSTCVPYGTSGKRSCVTSKGDLVVGIVAGGVAFVNIGASKERYPGTHQMAAIDNKDPVIIKGSLLADEALALIKKMWVGGTMRTRYIEWPTYNAKHDAIALHGFFDVWQYLESVMREAKPQ